jgi:hypothetical protein
MYDAKLGVLLSFFFSFSYFDHNHKLKKHSIRRGEKTLPLWPKEGVYEASLSREFYFVVSKTAMSYRMK